MRNAKVTAAITAAIAAVLAIALIGLLACTGWIVSEDARRQLWKMWSKPKGYGKITRNHARNPEYPQQERRG